MLDKNNDKRLIIKDDRIKHWLNIEPNQLKEFTTPGYTVSLMDPVKLREQPVKSAPGKKERKGKRLKQS